MKINYWKRLSRRQRHWVGWMAGCFVAYSIVGFLLLPGLIRWQMVKHLPQHLKRDVVVQQVRVNPWALSLSIRGFEALEPDGRKFLAWDDFYINFQASSLVRWAWTFAEIRLVRPYLEARISEDGVPNFANLLASGEDEEPPERPSGVPRLGINKLMVTNGVVVFEDRTLRTPFRTEFEPINVVLRDFKTKGDAHSPHVFTAESDAGKQIRWSGGMTVDPLRGSGHIELTHIDLVRFHPYLEDFIRAQLQEAMAEVHLDYQFGFGTNGTDLVISNGAVRLANLRFSDAEAGDEPVLVEAVDVEAFYFDLRSHTVRVGAVTVGGAEIHARRGVDGSINLVELFVPVPEASAPAREAAGDDGENGGAWHFELERLAVAGKFTVEDLAVPTPFRTTLEPLTLRMDRAGTRPSSEGIYQFEISTESAERFSGSGTLSIDPPGSRGEVDFEGVVLAKYTPYLESWFQGGLGGRLSVKVPYELRMEGDAIRGGVKDSSVAVSDLTLRAPQSGEPLVTVPFLTVESVEANIEEQRARIGGVHTSGGLLNIARDAAGRLNLLQLIRSEAGNGTAAEPAAAGPDVWRVDLEAMDVESYTIRVRDEALPRPAEFSLDEVKWMARNISSSMQEPVETRLSLKFNQAGDLTLHGTVTPQPLAAALGVTIDELELTPLGPYIESMAALGIRSGKASFRGEFNAQGADHGPLVTCAGDVALHEFMCTDLTVLQPMVAWDELGVIGIDFVSHPPSLAIEEISLSGLAAHVIIDGDGRMNVSSLIKPAAESESNIASVEMAAAPAVGNGGPPVIQLNTVRLERGTLSFEDNSIKPRAAMSIQELTGTVKDLGSSAEQVASVDLTAKMDGQSALSIRGRINPLAEKLYLDLEIINRDLQLSPLSPYMEKYAGYPLNRGRLSANLRYRVQEEQLAAENAFVIDQLTLGARNTSPDATSLPVKLGIALLKDREGRIDLKIPVQGRLDDPSFRVAPLVGKVIVNTITKAATSPFSLLGALVGGGEEMSYVEFEPGGTNMVAGEIEKLAKLAKALDQRPALNVDLEGAVDPARDGPALQLVKLREQIRLHRLKELEIRGESMAAAPAFVIDPWDYERLLRLRYQEVHSSLPLAAAVGASHGPAGATTAKMTGPVEKPRRSWVRKTLSKVGIGRRPETVQTSPESMAENGVQADDRSELELMEARLVQKIVVDPEDYLSLMQSRTAVVREVLMSRGGVGPDRLFLVAPRMPGADATGESRVHVLLN